MHQRPHLLLQLLEDLARGLANPLRGDGLICPRRVPLRLRQSRRDRDVTRVPQGVAYPAEAWRCCRRGEGRWRRLWPRDAPNASQPCATALPMLWRAQERTSDSERVCLQPRENVALAVHPVEQAKLFVGGTHGDHAAVPERPHTLNMPPRQRPVVWAAYPYNHALLADDKVAAAVRLQRLLKHARHDGGLCNAHVRPQNRMDRPQSAAGRLVISDQRCAVRRRNSRWSAAGHSAPARCTWACRPPPLDRSRSRYALRRSGPPSPATRSAPPRHFGARNDVNLPASMARAAAIASLASFWRATIALSVRHSPWTTVLWRSRQVAVPLVHVASAGHARQACMPMPAAGDQR